MARNTVGQDPGNGHRLHASHRRDRGGGARTRRRRVLPHRECQHAVDYHTFHPAAKHSLDLSAIVQNALALNSLGIIQLGLLVLIATPIVRVILSVVAFALERDLLYVAVTVVVLAVLLYSFLAKGT